MITDNVLREEFVSVDANHKASTMVRQERDLLRLLLASTGYTGIKTSEGGSFRDKLQIQKIVQSRPDLATQYSVDIARRL